MNKLFKEIRHGDIDAVQAAISKNTAVVNEVYSAKAPKKDIGRPCACSTRQRLHVRPA